MAALPVSVIVVSRHRPALLLRCIEALRQQDHPRIELVVVADPAAARAVCALDLPLKLAEFDEANISAARNVGLALASGEVVALIDDDAVAEPTWLSRLTAPFADPEVTQAGGFVRGRNGFSFQWRAMEVDATGRDFPCEVPPGVSLYRGSGARSVKTQGTNCSFRRAAICDAGGFDPAFRFYLDDADANLRLAALGGLTAIVPEAEVHHAFAASAVRRADRVPLDLHEVGASAAVFLRRHAPGRMEEALRSLRQGQRARLLRMMVAGGIEPRAVGRLMAGLDGGVADGLGRALLPLSPIGAAREPFLALPGTGPKAGALISGWHWQARALEARAAEARAEGRIVTVLRLFPWARPHRMAFGADGVWRQSGGLFGRSVRHDPIFRFWRMRGRVESERTRLAAVRAIASEF